MNWKKKSVIVLTLLLFVILVYQWPNRSMSGPDALEMLIQTSGATVVEGEAQFYATLEKRFQTMDELEAILLQVAELLGLKGGQVQKSEGPTYRVLDVTGTTLLGPAAHIVVQSNPGTDAGMQPQTYLLITCRDSSVTAIATIVKRLDEILAPYAQDGQLSYYLTGELSGRHTSEEMEKIVQNALAAVRGTIVEGMKDEELISYTAYTPLLDRYLAVDGDRFNLNVAIRYDHFSNKTIVWAGFPLIHDPY